MNMKVLYRILSGACMTLLFIACEDESSATPYARMTVDKTTLQLNESMVVKFTGIADQVAIFTGDESHNYELRSQNNTGMVVNKGVFTYSYSVPGTYRVVCVASTYLDLGKDMRVDTASVIVNVVDNVTDIDKLSSKIYYDEIYAEEKENDEWLLMLPYKMRYQHVSEIEFLNRFRFYQGIYKRSVIFLKYQVRFILSDGYLGGGLFRDGTSL